MKIYFKTCTQLWGKMPKKYLAFASKQVTTYPRVLSKTFEIKVVFFFYFLWVSHFLCTSSMTQPGKQVVFFLCFLTKRKNNKKYTNFLRSL